MRVGPTFVAQWNHSLKQSDNEQAVPTMHSMQPPFFLLVIEKESRQNDNIGRWLSGRINSHQRVLLFLNACSQGSSVPRGATHRVLITLTAGQT